MELLDSDEIERERTKLNDNQNSISKSILSETMIYIANEELHKNQRDIIKREHNLYDASIILLRNSIRPIFDKPAVEDFRKYLIKNYYEIVQKMYRVCYGALKSVDTFETFTIKIA